MATTAFLLDPHTSQVCYKHNARSYWQNTLTVIQNHQGSAGLLFLTELFLSERRKKNAAREELPMITSEYQQT
jgi:hypothetical protein